MLMCKKFIVVGLLVATPASAQMRGKGRFGGMMCPGLETHSGLMHDPEIKLMVAETGEGIKLEWSSKNPEKVKQLKDMGRRMEIMHERQLLEESPKPKTSR